MSQSVNSAVTIAPGLLRSISSQRIFKRSRGPVFIITDTRVHHLFGRTLRRELSRQHPDVAVLELVPGERSKTPGTVAMLQTTMLRSGVRRDSLVVALGGGVVGDIAGFVASTILRGIPYLQVPTTLLAQVDSSIGGKVGVNHPLGKNLIGSFYPPAAIFTDPSALRTLPPKEFRNGMAEVVKIAFACNRRFFLWLEREAGTISVKNNEVLTAMIRRSVRLKQSIVKTDRLDFGPRTILNFGHTIGHAIEGGTGFSVSHGEAVSIGMVLEGKIAVERDLLLRRDHERLIDLLLAFRLPVEAPSTINRRRFIAAVQHDKKRLDSELRLALPSGIGRMKARVVVSRTEIETALFGRHR